MRNLINELRKRATVAIAEPVAVAVAAAVEQTLSNQDGRITALHQMVEAANAETREARRQLADSGLEDIHTQHRIEAAVALAMHAGVLVTAFDESGLTKAIPPDAVVLLRKLDQLADAVLGQS